MGLLLVKAAAALNRIPNALQHPFVNEIVL
jgi:hypothetical protein